MAKRVPLISLTFGAAETEKTSAAISQNEGVHQGKCTHIKITLPAFTNNPTATIADPRFGRGRDLLPGGDCGRPNPGDRR